jgi:transposase
MFDYLGGVPEIVVPDNLRSGVTSACRYDPQHNPSYLQLAEHYGVAVLPACPCGHHPKYTVGYFFKYTVHSDSSSEFYGNP